MEQISDQERLGLLEYHYDKVRHEVDFLRKR